MKRFQTAFTLLELLITLTIAAILAVIAAPSFTALIANNHSVATAQEMVNAIRLARSEAVKRGARVSICASANGTSCSGGWSSGWIVFVDAAATDVAAPIVTSSQRIKHFAGDSRAAIGVLKNGVSQSYIRFSNQGLLARATNDLDPVVITSQYSGCTGQAARQIQLSVAGSVALIKQNCT